VKPRASRDAIEGPKEGALLVRLTAPAREGAANEALARLLARALGVAPSSVRVLHGAGSRDKILHVSGIGRARVLQLVPAADARA
jgi:uncharacterized protein YggU (UPF0235/DUF167 family)